MIEKIGRIQGLIGRAEKEKEAVVGVTKKGWLISPIRLKQEEVNYFYRVPGDFDERYQITIASKYRRGGKWIIKIIRTYLQDRDLRFNITGSWEKVVPVEGGVWGMLAKAATFSLVHKISTRRAWISTSPIKIEVPLKFITFDSAAKDVVEPIKVLQEMVSPDEWGGLLRPPGPNPYYTDLVAGTAGGIIEFFTGRRVNREEVKMYAKGELIAIWIGKYLYFPSVIITDFGVAFANVFDTLGNPVSADAKLVFETYQVCTKEDLKQIYGGREK